MWYAVMLLASQYVGSAALDVPVAGNPMVASDSTFARTLPAAIPADATHASRPAPTRVEASTRALAPSWSSSFAYARDGIFVRVALDGVDAGWFLLDTGASATVVDTSVVRERHLAVIGHDSVEGTAGTMGTTLYELGNVSVNGATAIAVTGIAQDLRGFPSPDGKPLAGILGSDFLGAYAVRIDYATHEVTFTGAAADSTLPGRTRIHFDLDHGSPRVPVTLDGCLMTEFRIDTGLHGADGDAPYLAVTEDVWLGIARARTGQVVTHAVWVRGLGDGDVVRPAVQIARVTIGAAGVDAPWVIPQPPRGYFARPDAVSLLGNGVLQRFSPVTIDFLTGSLYLTVAK